jgi:hypothetical protein
MPTKQDYDSFLAKRTAELIRENFAQKGVTNFLVVKTGRKWKRTLGHIKTLENKEYGSLIEINPLLLDLDVPEYVLDYVIMHELTHYFQGFCSNHEKKHRHPHKGRVVEKELARRGWEELTVKADKWIKAEWDKILLKNGINPTVTKKKRKENSNGKVFSDN